MLKFKTSCAVLANLSSNLLNEVGLSLFRYFKVGLRVCDIVVNKFTFAISSTDEFLLHLLRQYLTHGGRTTVGPLIEHNVLPDLVVRQQIDQLRFSRMRFSANSCVNSL